MAEQVQTWRSVKRSDDSGLCQALEVRNCTSVALGDRIGSCSASCEVVKASLGAMMGAGTGVGIGAGTGGNGLPLARADAA